MRRAERSKDEERVMRKEKARSRKMMWKTWRNTTENIERKEQEETKEDIELEAM